MPFLLFVMFSLCLIVPLVTIGNVYLLVVALWERDGTGIVEGVKNMICFLLFAMFPGMMILSFSKNGIPLVPDVGVALRERDQVAALLGGITTLGFTVGHLVSKYVEKNKESREGNDEELQTLASHAH